MFGFKFDLSTLWKSSSWRTLDNWKIGKVILFLQTSVGKWKHSNFFRLIFLILLSMTTRLLQSYLPKANVWKEEGEGEIYWDIFVHVRYFIFYYDSFTSKLNYHLLYLIQTKIAVIRWICSVWWWIRYSRIGKTSGQNLVVPKFGEGSTKGPKPKKCSFSSQSICNSKLYDISKNQPIRPLEGEIRGVFPLLTLKKDRSSSTSSPNRARKLKFGM